MRVISPAPGFDFAHPGINNLPHQFSRLKRAVPVSESQPHGAGSISAGTPGEDMHPRTQWPFR